MTTDAHDGESNGERPPGPYEPQTPEEFDQDREWLAGGMVKAYAKGVAEAEAEVDQALERGDRVAFAEWAKRLGYERLHLEHWEHEHMRAQLRRLEGDDDTPQEVLA